MPGFHIEHFGCRAARADGEAIGDRLRAFCDQELLGSDVVVVNTCSVTAEADRQARAFIRRAHRTNPEAKIVVTGCYAQRAPGELTAMPGVAAVIGNSHKALAPQIVFNLAQTGNREAPPAADSLVSVQSLIAGAAPVSPAGMAPVWADDRFAHSFIEEAQIVPGTQTRPNLKIQEGCGNRCTFCVIPLTRGPSRSLPAASVMRQVEGFVAAGGKELVLSGINLGRWGRDFSAPAKTEIVKAAGVAAFGKTPHREQEVSGHDLSRAAKVTEPVRASAPEGFSPHTLSALVRQILEQTALPRLRLSSIEPMDWDSDLIGLLAEFDGSRLARHAHLPLQSGSDAVLRRMHRRYRPWHYVEKIEALVRAAGPDLTIGADVMVGFPGETAAEFEETLDLVRALPFGYLHLFPFSPRPATRGWALHAQSPVAAAAVEERMSALRALAAEKSRIHRRRFVGRELDAITLHTPAALAARGRTAALTENFVPVEMEGCVQANELVRIRVTGLTAEGALEGCQMA